MKYLDGTQYCSIGLACFCIFKPVYKDREKQRPTYVKLLAQLLGVPHRICHEYCLHLKYPTQLALVHNQSAYALICLDPLLG